MASSWLPTLRAAFLTLVALLAPQAGLANLTDVDLSKLRSALRAIEAEVKIGLTEPADMSAIWASLPLKALETVTLTQSNSSQSALPSNTATPNIGTTDFRLMLATLAQTYTGENSTGVVNAQGPRGSVALSVRAGTVSFADLIAYSKTQGLQPLSDGTLVAPIVIWPGATLRISAGERVSLSRETGAFILSLGNLEVDGASFDVTGSENAYTPSFEPFVTVASGGSLILKNSTLRGLGFGKTAKFSGLSVAGNLLQQTLGQVVITGNLFDGLKNVNLNGVTGATVSGNTFINVRDNTLSLTNAPKSLVSNNFFSGGSSTNSIRIDKGSSETRISENIFFLGKRVAMLVTGASDRVKVNNNIVWNRDGAGVKFLRTRCGLISDNVFLDNRQKGIEIRQSNGSVVRDNLIAGNRSAGIWVSAQQANARTSLSSNVLIANGSGLSAATGAEILMHHNDFTRQLPRLLDGDISRLTTNIVKDLGGTASLRLKDGVADQGVEMSELCGGAL